MSILKSTDDLNNLKKEILEKSGSPTIGLVNKIMIKVSLATCGIAAGGNEIKAAIEEELAKQNINEVEIKSTGCMGYCYAEPTVEVYIPGKDSIVFGNVDDTRAVDIVKKYIKDGELIEGLLPHNYKTIDEV